MADRCGDVNGVQSLGKDDSTKKLRTEYRGRCNKIRSLPKTESSLTTMLTRPELFLYHHRYKQRHRLVIHTQAHAEALEQTPRYAPCALMYRSRIIRLVLEVRESVLSAA